MASTRPDLRVGDAERDSTATSLREHYAQGRLSTDELNERLDAAFSATTAGQLEQVTHDLPVLQAAPPAAAAPPVPARPRQARHAAGRALTALATLAAVITIFSVVADGGNHVGRAIAAVLIALLVVRGLVHAIFGQHHGHHDHHHHDDRRRHDHHQRWDHQDWDRRAARYAGPDDGAGDRPGLPHHQHHHEHHRSRNGHGYSYRYEYHYEYPGDDR
jgi:uncharacterized membrane protein